MPGREQTRFASTADKWTESKYSEKKNFRGIQYLKKKEFSFFLACLAAFAAF